MRTPFQEYQAANRRIAWMAVLTFLFMLVLALVPAVRQVAGLERGSTVDFHRDEAFLRALLEGHYGGDPVYLGGGMWYTPLVTWLEGAVAWLWGMPASLAIVQLGPYANLLAPVSFFLMCWYFLGPVRAVAASAVFLFFIIGQAPSYVVATYSARLIPVSFSQWFFYVELVLIDRAFRSKRIAPSMLAGFWAGISFLSHAGPAMISVLIIAILTIREVASSVRGGDRPAAKARALASLWAGVAFIVATLPLTWHLLTNRSVASNDAGFMYTYYGLTLRHIRILAFHTASVIYLIATMGIWALWRKRAWSGASPLGSTILFAWPLVAMALFLYSYAAAVLRMHYGLPVHPLLPTFHFIFYFTAALSVFAGVAVVELVKWAWRRNPAGKGEGPEHGNPVQAFAFFAAVALACTLHYPAYVMRRDATSVRNRDLAFQADTAGAMAVDLVNRRVPWAGVVLCDKDLAVWPMLPAGRHVVATASTMGNPYMDQARRDADRDLLMKGMEQPMGGTAALLQQYQVSHLLVRPADLARLPGAARWFPHEVFRNSGYVLLSR